jgi:uncharacterized membrane protein YcaP (DUF421 family)
MDWQELALTAGRGVLVYAVMLLVIRVLGKRTVGNFTAFDLLVALMLGEVVDEIIYGDVSLAQGLVSILVVAGAKYLTTWITCRSETMSRILEGAPRPLVKNGELQRDGLRAELMHPKEVMAALRLQGVTDLREVKLALMEVDGGVSVIREPWAEALQKRDLPSGPQRDEHAPIRTDAPEAI